MKGKVGWTLDPDVIDNIEKAAASDGRSPSNWVNNKMKIFFREHPVE